MIAGMDCADWPLSKQHLLCWNPNLSGSASAAVTLVEAWDLSVLNLMRYGIYPALETAGMPYRKRASGCHAFRHLVGSVIHKETRSLKLAQKQLGHSNISTTGDIYTHVEDGEIDLIAAILGNALGGICGRSVVVSAREGKNVQ